MNPIMRRYVKHATLIEKCYPAEKISDPTPKSNELSYLIYYAQSKPAKLAKLGSYLEKRIQRDLYRRRSNDIKIDLAIFNALVNSCSKDLSFFIKNLVFSLRDVTITGDPELIWLASHTFTKFCAYHDGSTLSIDPDLCSAYRGLIKTFGSYAQSNAVSDFERLRYRLIGLRAVHALVESSATYSSDNRSEPSVLIPAILANMSPPSLSDRRSLATLESMIESLAADGDKNFVDQLLASLEGSDNICEDTVSFGDLDRWAYHILHRLAKNSHASHIRSLAHGVVRYLDLTDMWSLREWVTLLFRCIMDALPPHQQTIVIFEILSQLDWRSPWGIAADTGPPTSGLNDADIKDSSPLIARIMSSGTAYTEYQCIYGRQRQLQALPSASYDRPSGDGIAVAGENRSLQPLHWSRARSRNEIPPDEGWVVSMKELERQICITCLLSWLFHDRYVMVGTSVLDVLEVLVFNLLGFIDSESPFPQIPLLRTNSHNVLLLQHAGLSTTMNVPDSTDTIASTLHYPQMKRRQSRKSFAAMHDHDSLRQSVEQANPATSRALARYYLLHTIGGLACHHYYSEQMADMVSFLYNQIKAIGTQQARGLMPETGREASSGAIDKVGDSTEIQAGKTDSRARPEIQEKRKGWLVQAMYEVIVRSNRISIGQGAELGHSAKSQEVASTPCAVTLAAIKPIVLLYNQLGDAELQLRFEVGKVLVTVFRHNAQVRQRTDPQGDFIDVSTDSVKRSAVRRTTSELMKYYSVVYNLLTRDVATGKGTDSCGPGSAQLQPQRQASATPSDYVAIGAALCAITEWLHMREVVIILQMLYTARQTLTCAVEGAASRQHPHIQLLATETLIGVYLSRLAQVLASDAEGEKLELVKEFSEYVRSVINARQELNRPGERVAWISTIDDMSKEDISKWELLEFPRNIDYLSPLSSAISVPDGTAREEEGNKAAVPMFEPLKVIEYLSQLGKLSGNQLRDDGLAPVDLTQFEPIDLRDVAKSLLSLELRQEDIDSEDNKERRSMPSGILDRINPHVMFKAVPSDDGTASEEESRQESVEGDVEGEVETAGKNWLRTASTRDSVATPVNFSYLKLALSQGLVDLSSVGVSTLSESNHAIDSTTRVYAHGNSGGGSSNVSGTVNAPSSSSSSSAKATPSSVRQEDINKQMDEDPKDDDDDENYQDQVVKLLDSLDIVYTPSGGSSGRDRETPASTTTTAHHRSMTVVHYRKACHDHDDRQSLTLLTDPFASPASMPATLRPSRHTDD